MQQTSSYTTDDDMTLNTQSELNARRQLITVDAKITSWIARLLGRGLLHDLLAWSLRAAPPLSHLCGGDVTPCLTWERCNWGQSDDPDPCLMILLETDAGKSEARLYCTGLENVRRSLFMEVCRRLSCSLVYIKRSGTFIAVIYTPEKMK